MFETRKEIKYEGKYLKFLNHDTWEYVERKNCNGAVIILAMTDDKKVILIEQYRKPLEKNIIEFPAGLVSDNGSEEKIEDAAMRELEEETGYHADKITYLTEGPTAPGLCTEILSYVIAHDIKKVSVGGGVDSENIIIHEVPFENVNNWLKEKQHEGLLVDLKVYGGLYFLQQKY